MVRKKAETDLASLPLHTITTIKINNVHFLATPKACSNGSRATREPLPDIGQLNYEVSVFNSRARGQLVLPWGMCVDMRVLVSFDPQNCTLDPRPQSRAESLFGPMREAGR